jgi:hypothetical protein
MNVLILTPDAVGGTFLERLLTIYMQFHSFDKPVIGFHDLSLGVEEYFSPEFNRNLLKSIVDAGKDYQKLDDVVRLLKSADFYKVGKLTHYMSTRRQDSIKELVPFYHYLNNNFYIIACRRNNVFEHALSWGINKITNALNVYSVEDKIDVFFNLYQDGGLRIDPLSLKHSLESYKRYLQWVEDNFSVASYYIYEKDAVNIEDFILNLPIFKGQRSKISWKDVYGISMNDWNKYHYLSGDMSSFALEHSTTTNTKAINYQSAENTLQHNFDSFLKSYNNIKGSDWPVIQSIEEYENLPQWIKNECEEFKITYFLEELYIIKNGIENRYDITIKHNILPHKEKIVSSIENYHADFLNEHKENYNKSIDSIKHMMSLGIFGNTVPMKKQTLRDKMLLVKNIDECLDVYNEWAVKNPDICNQIDTEQIKYIAADEHNRWLTNTLPFNKNS